ncbi:hypothetical protein BJ165DRAFT_1571810 [Panaeolus papilionaceus]|nr:hypothetical protein BJ165DRAFT_1571810 [Panaeolus papilionaceus]
MSRPNHTTGAMIDVRSNRISSIRMNVNVTCVLIPVGCREHTHHPTLNNLLIQRAGTNTEAELGRQFEIIITPEVRRVTHNRSPYPQFRCCEMDTRSQQQHHQRGHDWVKETKAKASRRHSPSGHRHHLESRNRSDSPLTARLSISPRPSTTSILHEARSPLQHSMPIPTSLNTYPGQAIPELKRPRAPKKSRLPLPISGPGSGGYLTYRLGTNPFPVVSHASNENVTNPSIADGQNVAIKTSPLIASLSAKKVGRAPGAVVKHVEHPTKSQQRERRDTRERIEQSDSEGLNIEMRYEQDSEGPKPRFRSAYGHNEVNVSVTLRPARE